MTDINEKRVKKILTKKKRQFCKQDNGRWFPYEGKESDQYVRKMKGITKMLNGKRNITLTQLSFKDLSYWYLLYSQFLKLCQDDTKGQKENFIVSTWLGYLFVQVAHRDVYSTPDERVAIIMAQCLICGWEKEAYSIAENMLESIELNLPKKRGDQKTKHNSIGTGSPYTYSSWLLLDIYCLMTNKSYNKEHAQKPDKYEAFYGDVLKNWNSKDLVKIEKLIYEMCDFHLRGAENKSLEFGDGTNNLFPFEVYGWLAYRKLNGLENPKEFSHPFMNQVLSQEIEGNRPFKRPNIEYVRPLFEMHEKEYPDVKVIELLEDVEKR